MSTRRAGCIESIAPAECVGEFAAEHGKEIELPPSKINRSLWIKLNSIGARDIEINAMVDLMADHFPVSEIGSVNP